MKFKKSYGQVFLRDKSYIQKIMPYLAPADCAVLEIGGGSGVITRRLIASCRRLYCIEKDIFLVKLLRERFSAPGVHILQGDVLALDLCAFNEPLIIFGNIPYYISNRLLQHLLAHRRCIQKVYLTLQKEYAHKLTARPHSKEYSFLACHYGYFASIRLLFDIPRTAFFPQPKVDSSFIEITYFTEYPLRADDEQFLFKVLKSAFSQRRKKLSNSLKALIPPQALKKALDAVKIKSDVRPQEVSLKEFVELANYFCRKKDNQLQ